MEIINETFSIPTTITNIHPKQYENNISTYYWEGADVAIIDDQIIDGDQ